MVILERAEAFHRHVDECNHCTTGAAEADFCYRGRVLLLSASSEALLLIESAEERDREAAKPRAAAPAQAYVETSAGPVAVAASDRPARASGVGAAADKLHSRVKRLNDPPKRPTIQPNGFAPPDRPKELAPGDVVSQEGGALS